MIGLLPHLTSFTGCCPVTSQFYDVTTFKLFVGYALADLAFEPWNFPNISIATNIDHFVANFVIVISHQVTETFGAGRQRALRQHVYYSNQTGSEATRIMEFDGR